MLTIALSLISSLLIQGSTVTLPQKIDNAEFSIEYPRDWRADESGDGGSKLMLYSPLSDEEDTYSDFIALNVLAVAENTTLDNFSKQAINDIPFFYQKSKITVNRKEVKSGHDCQILEYSGEFNGFPLSFRQYTWVINSKAYTLTFTSEQISFEKQLPLAISVMDSFILKTATK